MRIIRWFLPALLLSAFIPLLTGGPAQAATTAQPTVVQVTIHGHPTTLHAASSQDASTEIAKINAINAQAVRPNATNPCYGDGLLCLFQNGDGGGSIIAFTEAALFEPGPFNLTDFPLGTGTWNDQMSSWGNDIGGDTNAATMCWWTSINSIGVGHLMRPLGATVQNLRPNENDTASSVDTKMTDCS
jgi:Peptidase inhibitor family I36